jgi:hypothetical protein
MLLFTHLEFLMVSSTIKKFFIYEFTDSRSFVYVLKSLENPRGPEMISTCKQREFFRREQETQKVKISDKKLFLKTVGDKSEANIQISQR